MNSSYLHTAEGRLRVKITGLKRSPEISAALEGNLRSLDGVSHVNANPLTGNLLVLFEPEDTNHEQIINRLKQEGYLKTPQKSQKAVGGDYNKVTKAISEMVIQMAVEAALKRLIFAMI
jgi:cation transport ATPase